MKTIKWLGLFFTLAIAGCTTSRITTWWKAENIIPKSYHKILVLGLINTADRSIQQNMEDHMVGDLHDLGYDAISSLREYGPKAFNGMSEETALKKLGNSGVDAVITIVLLQKEKDRTYVPSGIYYGYHNRFWDYQTALYNRIYEPGYYLVNTRYFWESNLYDMSDQKLIYSVQTQSFSPADSESLGHEYGQMIIKNMVQQKVLQNYHASVVASLGY